MEATITPAEHLCLHSYVTDQWDTVINGFLRRGNGHCPAADIAILDSLTAYPLSPGQVLYRGIVVPDAEFPAWKPGMLYTDEGFLSTSTDPASAEKFAKGGGVGQTGVMIEIHGVTTGCMVNDTLHLPGSFYREHEVILPRSLRLTVTNAKRRGRILHVKATRLA